MIIHVLRLAAAAVALAGAHPAAVQAQSPSFWVMSYNIRYDNPDDRPDWRARRGPMARQISFFSPDILGLQEALVPMVADLSVALPDYAHYGVGRDDGDKAGENHDHLLSQRPVRATAGADPVVLADARAAWQGVRRGAAANLCAGSCCVIAPAACCWMCATPISTMWARSRGGFAPGSYATSPLGQAHVWSCSAISTARPASRPTTP